MIVRGADSTSPVGRTLVANLQPGTLTLAFDEQTVLTYDRAGRLWSAFLDGVTHRRGYNGRVLARHSAGGQRVRRWLSERETDALVARAAGLVRSLKEGVCAWDAPPELVAELKAGIARAADFTPQAAAQDARLYHSIYKPIGILPPDQYLALVLQLTEGCSFNACTFCTLYRARPFRIKSPVEFRAHIAAVLHYLGAGLPLRKSIFLADANALVVAQKQLVELLDVMRAEMKNLPAFQVCSFLDGFSGAQKSPGDYAELAGRGIRRIYIGMESGHDPLLRFLNKPGAAADVVAAAQAIKAGGMQVCIIVLVGAGGTRFADGHICDTVKTINALGLGAGDLIYFSELVAQPGQPYGVIAARENIEALSVRQLAEQRCAIQAGLRFDGPPPKLATYDIREFVY